MVSINPAPFNRCTSIAPPDRKSTRLNSSHSQISYAVFCLKKKKDALPLPLLEVHLLDRAGALDRLIVADDHQVRLLPNPVVPEHFHPVSALLLLNVLLVSV